MIDGFFMMLPPPLSDAYALSYTYMITLLLF